VGGVPEVVEDGINGYLVPPQRPDLLAEAIEKCLSFPALAQKMGEAGYQKVENEFTFEGQTKRLEGIYEEILSGIVKG
jgi:glycosyltransferase involved in cell wall biosynthesis